MIRSEILSHTIPLNPHGSDKNIQVWSYQDTELVPNQQGITTSRSMKWLSDFVYPMQNLPSLLCLLLPLCKSSCRNIDSCHFHFHTYFLAIVYFLFKK